MNTEKIENLLNQIHSTAEGLRGTAWAAKCQCDDKWFAGISIEVMAVQLDNLQAALNELKAGVKP
ncbi:MAG: hypothetical protein R3F02_05625 [Thiolinea sp.]